VLGIETSCDETSAAVVQDGRKVMSCIVMVQNRLHEPFGGIVPEIAARAHLRQLGPGIKKSLEDAGVDFGDIDLIAVTCGPGLFGSLHVGVGMALGISASVDVPIVGVHHLAGHVYGAFLEDDDIKPPLLALVVSGAHTELVYMYEHYKFKVLGRTRDDAAGEAFDKAARLLGLGFPGGPELDKLARQAGPSDIRFPIPILDNFEFSFSGLKTALLYKLRDLGNEAEERKPEIAWAFQDAVARALIGQLIKAIDALRPPMVVIAGGVAANSRLRELAEKEVTPKVPLKLVPLRYCTDNAAMIASAGYWGRNRLAEGIIKVDPIMPWPE